MGLRRQMGMSGNPEDDFARKRLLAVLGAHMMSNPDPRAIGGGLGAGTLASVDARTEFQERQRAIAMERQREDDRRFQLSERQRMLQERARGDEAAQSEAQRLAQMRSKLIEVDPNASFYSPKQLEEQYVKRFGYQEPEEPKTFTMGHVRYREIGRAHV